MHCSFCITKNPHHSTPKVSNRPFPLVVEGDLRPETEGPHCECKPSQNLVQNIQSCRIPCCIIPHLGSFEFPEISKVGPTITTCKYPLLFQASDTALAFLQLYYTPQKSKMLIKMKTSTQKPQKLAHFWCTLPRWLKPKAVAWIPWGLPRSKPP